MLPVTSTWGSALGRMGFGIETASGEAAWATVRSVPRTTPGANGDRGSDTTQSGGCLGWSQAPPWISHPRSFRGVANNCRARRPKPFRSGLRENGRSGRNPKATPPDGFSVRRSRTRMKNPPSPSSLPGLPPALSPMYNLLLQVQQKVAHRLPQSRGQPGIKRGPKNPNRPTASLSLPPGLAPAFWPTDNLLL